MACSVDVKYSWFTRKVKVDLITMCSCFDQWSLSSPHNQPAISLNPLLCAQSQTRGLQGESCIKSETHQPLTKEHTSLITLQFESTHCRGLSDHQFWGWLSSRLRLDWPWDFMGWFTLLVSMHKQQMICMSSMQNTNSHNVATYNLILAFLFHLTLELLHSLQFKNG